MFYILSDFLMLGMVAYTYTVYKGTLYKYAYFKFVFTSILLALNFLVLGYGGFIIYKMPTNFDDSGISE
jgi:hypothetical protein